MSQLARMALAALAGGAAVFGMAPFNAWPALVAKRIAIAKNRADKPRFGVTVDLPRNCDAFNESSWNASTET